MKIKKAIIPTLWLLCAALSSYNAWNYYMAGKTGFVCINIIVSVLFLVNAIKGYINLRKETHNK